MKLTILTQDEQKIFTVDYMKIEHDYIFMKKDNALKMAEAGFEIAKKADDHDLYQVEAFSIWAEKGKRYIKAGMYPTREIAQEVFKDIALQHNRTLVYKMPDTNFKGE